MVKKYAHFRNKKFEQGFGKGKGLEESNLTSQAVQWLEQAIDAYWRQRLYSILDLLNQESEEKVSQLWLAALEDMHGDDQARNVAIYQAAINDDKISLKAKAWLKKLYKTT